MREARRILSLLGIAALVAAGANALSPGRLTWHTPTRLSVAATAARAGFGVVDAAQLAAARQRGAVVLDVRVPEAYRRGHVPGAVSFPAVVAAELLPSWQTRLEGAAVYVYCGHADCDAALAVALLLRRRGIDHVRLFVGGFEAWERASREVEA